jgi:hypothetical protein
VPHLSAIDPITRQALRSSRRSTVCYELGHILEGNGWQLHGRHAAVSVANRHKKIPIGYCYIHTGIDDHPRLAHSEALPNSGWVCDSPPDENVSGHDTLNKL